MSFPFEIDEKMTFASVSVNIAAVLMEEFLWVLFYSITGNLNSDLQYINLLLSYFENYSIFIPINWIKILFQN